MIEFFKNLDLSTYFVPIITFAVGWIAKIIYERYTLSFKLKKEYEFKQKIKLKEEIAKNKMHLLNSAEELNHRLWNFSQHVGENWHSVSKQNWFTTEQYYINSFVYRFLKFLHWTIQTEKDTISLDSIVADKNDILFLKYVKTFKDIFTDADLLADLGYDRTHDTNHFFKNDLKSYSKWIIKDNEVIDFDDFKLVLESNYEPLEKIIEYFTKIENTNSDKNLNVLRCCHLILIQFLNTFGHDYQKTKSDKIKTIAELYKSKLMIKNEFCVFIKKSKLEKELCSIYKKIK